MSPRRRKKKRPGALAPETAGGAPAPATGTPQGAPPLDDPSAGPRRWVAWAWAVGIAAVLLAIALGHDRTEPARRGMLEGIEALQADGSHARAQELLGEYARRWPGALRTADFNRRLGEAHHAVGEHEEAIERLLESLRLDPSQPGVRATIGVSLWESGRRDAAVGAFLQELEEIGDENDMANYYIGLFEYERGNLASAFDFWQAVGDRGPWAHELERIIVAIGEDVLEPARRGGEQLAAERFGPLPSSPEPN